LSESTVDGNQQKRKRETTKKKEKVNKECIVCHNLYIDTAVRIT
jgi:hypothetical protein